MIRGDASEFKRLALEMRASAVAALPAARAGVQEGTALVRAAWVANARATSGSHGRHYPASITAETRTLATSALGDVGPDSSRPQGGMGRGFEFGSVNQPPHLDGAKALDANESKIEGLLNAAVLKVLP